MIAKLLVANRGEIARRIMSTCTQMGISTVAIFSDPDAREPFVSDADEAVHLPGAAAVDTYLNGAAVIAAAKATGSDAIHPGYGFLAENAVFAQSVIDAGLIFVGPTPATIAAMGSKLESKRIMMAAGVPILVGEDLTGMDATEIAAAAERLGFPVLVKASAGGGGKGMRIVSKPADLASAVESARREAIASFGDDTLFVERYIREPRHVEIQIFGDGHGNVVHLFERECSIQRRHQKIIEESPSPAVDDALRLAMGEAAVAAGAAVEYLGAGTVEFLLTPEGEFFFLETNTRLQVEHPVTEMVTGLDLVRLQLLVAEGHPLPPEAHEATISGHAIEARLYAEDARNDYLPQTGPVHRLFFDSTVRLDTGPEDGSNVSVYYDPMLAKVIAHGRTREDAARVLARALATAEIHGVATNRDMLVRVLRHPEFLAGNTDTHFLDRHGPAELAAPLADQAAEHRHGLAAALAGQATRRSQTRVLPGVASGWRNSPSQSQLVSYRGDVESFVVGYRFGRTGFEASIDGESLGEVIVREHSGSFAEFLIDGRLWGYWVHQVDDVAYVDGTDGSSRLTELPRFPVTEAPRVAGSLLSPMPGKVIKVEVSPGATVAQGDVLVIVEAMKMEHAVRSPAAGTVTKVSVAEGDQVENEQLLVIVEPDED